MATNKISVYKEPHEMAWDLVEGKITLDFLRPSQLLDQMYQSVPPGEEESIIFRVLFIKQLPPNIHQELKALKHVSLRQLAEAANKLLPTTNIGNMPPEVLEIIFKNLKATKDIISCKKVCTQWKNVFAAMFKDKGKIYSFIKFQIFHRPTFGSYIGVFKLVFSWKLILVKDSGISLEVQSIVTGAYSEFWQNC